MVNLGNISVADLRLGAARVKAAYLGGRQVWGLGPVTPQYDVQSIGRSVSQQGASVEISEQAGETITLYIRTNAEELAGKQVCAAVYLDSADVTPYATFAFGNVSLAGGYIEGTTPDVSAWLPSGFPQTYSVLYMKTWIQDAGYVDPADALGTVLDWTAEGAAQVSNAFRLTAKQAGSTARITSGTAAVLSAYLEYSTDQGATWNVYTVDDTLTAAGAGDSILLRASNPNTGYTANMYPKIVTTGDFAASGRFDSMLRPDYESAPATYARSYTRLFYQSQGVSEVSAQGLYEYVQPDNNQGPFNQAFAETSALTSITFSDLKVANGSPIMNNANGMFTNAFSRSQNLLVVNFPELESISCQAFWAAFEQCPSLSAVLMPKLKNLDRYGFYSGAFDRCPSMRVLDFSGFESVPPLGSTNPFSGLPSSCSVIIPDSLYDTWTTATNWSSLPCQYVKKSEFGS